MGLLMYWALVQDVFVFDDVVATKRKAELSTSLMAVTVNASFLNLWIEKQRGGEDPYKGKTNLDQLMIMIRADPQNEGWLLRIMEGCKQTNQVTDQRLFLLHLATLDSSFEWIPTIALQESKIIYYLLELLYVTDLKIKEAVLDCLLTLVNRNFPPADQEVRVGLIWDPFFTQGFMTNIRKVWDAIHHTEVYGATETAQLNHIPASEQDYNIVKKLAQVVGTVGCAHVCFRRNVGVVPEGFLGYLEFVLALAEHPSTFVAGFAMDFLFDAIRHEYIRTVRLG